VLDNHSRILVLAIALVMVIVFGRSTRRAWLAIRGLRNGTISKLQASFVILVWLATLAVMGMLGYRIHLQGL
jgi:hypothetical protein